MFFLDPKCRLLLNESGSVLVCNLPSTEKESTPWLDENFDIPFELSEPLKMIPNKKKEDVS